MDRRKQPGPRRNDETDEDQPERNEERLEDAAAGNANRSARHFGASVAAAAGGGDPWNPPRAASVGGEAAAAAGMGRAAARRSPTNAVARRSDSNVARAAKPGRSKRGSKSDKSSLETTKRNSGESSSGRKRGRERRQRPPPQDRGENDTGDGRHPPQHYQYKVLIIYVVLQDRLRFPYGYRCHLPDRGYTRTELLHVNLYHNNINACYCRSSLGFLLLVWLPFSLVALPKLGRRLNEYQVGQEGPITLSFYQILC